MPRLSTLILLGLTISLNHLAGQTENNSLIGHWELVNNSYQTAAWGQQAAENQKSLYLSFDEQWKYAQQGNESVLVSGYQLRSDTLVLEHASFWVQTLTDDELQLVQLYEEQRLTSTTYRRLSEAANDLGKLSQFVNQEQLGPFQLRGYYQLPTAANPEEPIEEGDILVHNFRFYPDKRVLYVRHSYPEGSQPPFDCPDCTLDYEGMSSWSGNALPLTQHSSTNWLAQLALAHKKVDFSFRFEEGQLLLSIDGQEELPATFVPFGEWVPHSVKDLADFSER